MIEHRIYLIGRIDDFVQLEVPQETLFEKFYDTIFRNSDTLFSFLYFFFDRTEWLMSTFVEIEDI